MLDPVRMLRTVRAGVYGATGYTGLELIALLRRHPAVRIAFATSRSYAGQSLDDVDPSLPAGPSEVLVDHDAAEPSRTDVVFVCLPHGAAAPTVAAALAAGTRAIDLSADFRLSDPATYQAWYGVDHPAPELLTEAVYGLTEHARQSLAAARLVANPGCYPTSALLPLLPLVVSGAIDPMRPVVIDSKSGVTGAGRAPQLHTSFAQVHGNFRPYAIGRRHRHLPEMERMLGQSARGAGTQVGRLVFTPHLLPVDRGILSTLYVPLAAGWDPVAARAAVAEAYRGEPFVVVLDEGAVVSLEHVVRTNRCAISFHAADDDADGASPMAIIVSAVDNLVKGAAGQAVQNMNVMFGLDETLGLTA